MRWAFILLCVFLLFGCETIPVPEPIGTPANAWAVQRLWPVLDARDKRATGMLCAFLKDGAPEVRQAAATAFASVQDTAAIRCLLPLLDDHVITVRAAAIHALGFIADRTTVLRMDKAASAEKDSTVLIAFSSAILVARLRNEMLDPKEIIELIDQGQPHDRAWAADVFRRLPDSTISNFRQKVDRWMTTEGPEVRQFLILAMGKMGEVSDTTMLRQLAMNGAGMEKVNALRALGALGDVADTSVYFAALSDPITNRIALEQLERSGKLNGRELLQRSRTVPDRTTEIVLLRLAMENGKKKEVLQARKELDTLRTASLTPYEKAEWIRANYLMPVDSALEQLTVMMRDSISAPERQAAFQAALHVVRERMSRSRYTDANAQYAEMAEVMGTALNTGDAGLIAAAAEELLKEEGETLSIVFPEELERKAKGSLQPITDLEAQQLLEKVSAKRDGQPAPVHELPAYNHPIDMKELLDLDQGQEYRIVTSKGEIVIKTNVNEAPGSSLAFDSLVTAGFYNGKAFHRVVPNFVVQTGCPRGDGYGGMPWTLRTEIGRTPFTAGSVGLASAGRDTEGSQFFITHSATPHLDCRYTRFGEVVSGMEVVWKIQVGDVMEKVEKLDRADF